LQRKRPVLGGAPNDQSEPTKTADAFFLYKRSICDIFATILMVQITLKLASEHPFEAEIKGYLVGSGMKLKLPV
jgi:hypothetical protein